MAKKQKAGRIKIHEVTAENDIRYRGPLNYQHFQILGWLCIVLSQAAIIMEIAGRLDASITEQFSGLHSAFSMAGNLSLPFLLIANFAQILDDSDGYKKQLIKNSAAAVAVALMFLLLYNRYLIGSLAGLFVHPDDAERVVSMLIYMVSPVGFLNFNLFIDLLLCTLVMLFLNYKPKKWFQGKLLHVFRLFALLPIAYEVCCMVLKVQSAHGELELPPWSFPLLTVKPPMTFVLFLILAVYIKARELRFLRHGKTREEYKAFLRTNRNSRNFSLFLAAMLVVVSLLDFVTMTGFSVISSAVTYQKRSELKTVMAANGADSAGGSAEKEAEVHPSSLTEEERAKAEKEATQEELTEIATQEVQTATALGFGGSVNLITLAPLVLLFSYTRTPRSTKMGIFIPLGGIVLILFLYLEAFRMLMWNLPIQKLDLEKIVSEISQMMQ